MIWLTWRQFRASALAVFGVVGAVAAALASTGPKLYREYADLMDLCGRPPSECYDDFFFSRVGVHSGLILFVVALPVVVGVFWGAPLISREFETGTQDLVWQQSVPRRRWLAVKLGITGLAAIGAAALAVFPVSWWSRPLDVTAILGLDRMSPIVFDARGYVVLGHTAFAFALGAAAGLLIRRAVPAMAVTFAVFVAAQIVMPAMIRPHLVTPVRAETVVTARNVSGIDASVLLVDAGQPGAWILSNEMVDSAGHTVSTMPGWVTECDTPEAPEGEIVQQRCLERLAAEGYRQAVTYHPAERFWLFQAYETAIFGVLGVLLIGFCFLRIRPH